MKCHECQFVNLKFEPFMYFTVPVFEESNSKKKIELNECFQEFLKTEKLEGVDKW